MGGFWTVGVWPAHFVCRWHRTASVWNPGRPLGGAARAYTCCPYAGMTAVRAYTSVVSRSLDVSTSST